MTNSSEALFTLDELVAQSYETNPRKVALMREIVDICSTIESDLPQGVNRVTLSAMVMLGGELETIRAYFEQKHHGTLTQEEISFIKNDLPKLKHLFDDVSSQNKSET